MVPPCRSIWTNSSREGGTTLFVAEARFTPKARQDLDDIRNFPAQCRGQADRYVITIVGVGQGLATGREAGAVREGYATYRTGSHVVFFRRVDDGGADIEIVRILHERMDPSRHMR